MAEALTLSSLPLFPLGTVLYPGGLLPLRIFEVRYLDMIGKCHKAGAPFGVVALTEGSEVRQRNPSKKGENPAKEAAAEAPGDGFAAEGFCNVGTLAHIADFLVPQPGLMVIRCTGMQRFSINNSKKLKHGLWVADVTQLDEDQSVAVPEDLQPTADALGKLIKTLQERGITQDEMPLLPPFQLGDCGWLANRWCELLPIPLELKQRLMVLDNPLVRLELVGDILERTGIAF